LAAERNALFQLAQIAFVQSRRELWLSGEDDRQQLGLVGFDVGEQTDLFEQLQRKTLRLVNDQDARLAATITIPQQLLQLDEECRLRAPRRRLQLEAHGQHL